MSSVDTTDSFIWLDNDEEHIARIFQKLYDVLNDIIHQLLVEHFIDVSFRSIPIITKPTSSDYINTLEIIKYTEQYNSFNCAICQMEFIENDHLIKLPCTGQNHYFHIDHSECPGVMPWLKDNNTCPVCKFELPSIKETTENKEEISNININPILEDELCNIIHQIILNILNNDNKLSIQDIHCSNIDLIDQFRESIHNSI